MPMLSSFFRNAFSVHKPYLQVLFVIIAFTTLTWASYRFTDNIERGHLEKDTDTMMYSVESQLNSNLNEFKTMLGVVSENVSEKLKNDATFNCLIEYIANITDYGLNQAEIMGFNGVFGIFKVFGNQGFSGNAPDFDWSSFEPAARPWYIEAMAAEGEIAVTDPYLDADTGEYTVAFTRCLYDYDGNVSAIICIDFSLDRLYEIAIDNHASDVNYWMLLDNNLIIMSHPEEDFIGLPLSDTRGGIAELADELREERHITSRGISNYLEESKVITIRELDNGWYLGVITRTESYYSNLRNMQWFLTVFGSFSTAGLSAVLITIHIAKTKIEKRRDALESIAYKEQEANKQKSGFLANMSHEIRTPMNAILGIAEIQLQDETLSAEAAAAFRRIYESGDLLINIINDILDLSKIEAGKFELVLNQYDMPSLINDTVQLNRLRYNSKPIEFIIHIDSNTPHDLYGDELRIKQIINNILSNAFKYTIKGKVEFSVSAFESNVTPKPGEECSVIVFEIRDTGQGMNEEQLQALFDDYSRFNTQINRAIVGTGLGMSITKQLIELMNGSINIESTVGEGSVFTVRIPQRRISGEVCGARLTQKLQNSDFHGSTTTAKTQFLRDFMPYGSVLVVDDVESNIYVATGMLQPYGLNIERASNGSEVIALVESGKKYDVIFMDHMMPVMDGIEATRKLREMGYTNAIVALTANAIVGNADMFLDNGFNGFISKPIDSRELNLVLNDFVRDKKAKRITPAPARNGRKAGTAKVSEELAKAVVKDIKHTIEVFNDVLNKINNGESLNKEDLPLYTTTAHGLKSALLNIKESELSAEAVSLEKAGEKQDIELIKQITPPFIEHLHSLIKRYR
jgi:signal transduction histidine kinase/DNA-binding response OmpR family regulator